MTEEPGLKHKDYPFMEVDSYFGDFEILDKNKPSRQWNVVAKKNTLVYAIHRTHFEKLFADQKSFEEFKNATFERHLYFEKCERECKRALRRKLRATQKM